MAEDIVNRFLPLLRKIPDSAILAYPIIAPHSELMFDYSLDTDADGFDHIRRIRSVMIYDFENSDLKEHEVSEFFSKEEYAQILKQSFKWELNDIEKQDLFYELHEQILPFAFAEIVTEEQDALLRQYVALFAKLVPEGGLRNIYLKLGAEFFSYLHGLGISLAEIST